MLKRLAREYLTAILFLMALFALPMILVLGAVLVVGSFQVTPALRLFLLPLWGLTRIPIVRAFWEAS